jgi:co-chaperonin GroES (HSP10)
MIQPLDNQVLINPEPIKEITLASGLVITNPRVKTRKGKVIEVGKDITELKIGDKVEFLTLHSPEVDGMFLVDAGVDNCRIMFKYN